MSRILLITCCVCFFHWGFSQNCPLDSALLIPFSDTAKYDLEVFDVVNNDLGNPGQAVCSIDIDFDCNEISGLEMWLVSPGGDTVQLAGPVVNTGMFGSLGSNWDITFLNDSITASAEPDFPYDERFDHRVNQFPGGNYNGSYFPFTGSLKDFNSGPVNGTWQLLLHLTPNFLLVDGSQINDIHINFCDRRGYFCCFAEAGNLNEDSPLTACQGDSSLQTLDFSLNFPSGPADSSIYAYTYLLSQADTILAYDSLPDPSQFTPGSYQISGFSYQRDQRDSFPPTDGSYTLSRLRDTLRSDLPPFCGSITNNNRTITILPKPDTTELGTQTICEGESLIVGDSVLNTAGNYTIRGLAANGCDSLIQVTLNLRSPSRDTIFETTCDSGPFLSSTGNTLDSTGFYTFTYSGLGNCDSVVVVDFRNYSISPLIRASANAFSCQDSVITLDGTGSSTGYGSFSYRWEAPPFGQIISTDSTVRIDQPGRYTLQLLHDEGCAPIQTSITIGEDFTAPEAGISNTPTLSCTDPIIQLSGQAISGSGDYRYQWESSNGQILSDTTGLNPSTDRPGDYQFILTDTRNGCRDTAMVQVGIDTISPTFSILGNDTLNCMRTEINPSILPDNPSGNYTYEWLDAQGQAIPGGNTPSLTIRSADTFLLRINDLDNGCSSQQIMISRVDTLTPIAGISDPGLLDCQVRELDLMASSSLSLDTVAISWTPTNGGNIIAGDSSLSPTINAAGDYILTLTNTYNNCVDQVQVSVMDTSTSLTANIIQEEVLTCNQTSTVLNNGGSSTGANIQYTWTDLDHGTFSGQPGASVNISRPGRYQLLVEDTFTRCLEVATLTTTTDTLAPSARTGVPAQLDCNTLQVTLGDAASAQNVNLQYNWQGPCLSSRSDSIQVVVDCPGIYSLTVANTSNGCQETRSVEVSRDTTTPTAVVVDSAAVDCSTGLAFLDASASFGGELEWFYEGTSLNTNEDSLLVTNPGQYTLRVNNMALQCTDERTIRVTMDCQPEARILEPDSLNCQNTSVILDATNSTGVALDYRWTGPGGSRCFVSSDSSSTRVQVSCPGTYQLIVRNRVVDQSDTVRVEVIEDLNLPIADAGPDIVLTCVQDTLIRQALTTGNPAGANYRWNTSFGITLGNQAEFAFSAGGTYVLEVENPINNCIRRDTLLVNEPEVPSLEIRVPEVLNCADSAVLLDPLVFSDEALLTYSWSGQSGQPLSAPNQRTIEVNEPGFYRLTVRDTTNQCSTTDSIEVRLDRTIPQVEAGMDTTLNCNSPQVMLSGSVDAPGRSLEYLWITERSNGIADGEDRLNPTVQDTGTYQLVVLDLTNGCIGTDSLRVLPPRPLPDLSSLQDTLLTCTNTEIELSAPVNDTVIYSISWTGLTDAGLGIDTSFGSKLLATATGSYTLMVQDRQTSCVARQTIQVDIDTLAPVFTISSPDTLTCLEPEIFLTTLTPVDTTRFAFSWRSNNDVSPARQLPLGVRTPGQYTLRLSNLENGCQKEESVSVLENVNPPALDVPAEAILDCRNDTIRLEAMADSNMDAQWTGPQNGILSAADELNVRVYLPGTYEVEIRDPITGCTNQSSVLVSEDKIAPSLSIDSSRNLTLGCVQTSVILDASQANTTSGSPPGYEWNSLEGVSTEASLRVERPQTVQLQITDPQNGCTASYQFTVEQDQEQPRFTLETDGTLGCGNNDVQITAQFMNNPEGIEQIWSKGNNIISETTGSSISVQDTGIYRLQSINPASGCRFEEEVRVLSNPAIPRLRIEVDTSLDCEINQVRLEAQIENYSPQALVFNWRTYDGVILGDANQASIFAAEQGTYLLSAIHPSSGCEGEASGNVSRLGRRIEGLIFSVRPNDCDPDGGSQLAITEVNGGTAPYLYGLGGNGLQVNRSIEIAQAGTYSLAVEDINGCRFDTLLNLSIEDLPIVDLGPDISITEGDSTRLNAQLGSEQYEHLEWISGNEILATNTNELVVAPTQSTAYLVRSSSIEGCIFEDIVWVFVEEAPVAYLPTAFSPNNDGVNDKFLPGLSPKVIRIEQFLIYDRWGNTVHAVQGVSPDDPAAGWDGERRNESSPSAVYVYWLEITLENGERQQLKGEVLLIR